MRKVNPVFFFFKSNGDWDPLQPLCDPEQAGACFKSDGWKVAQLFQKCYFIIFHQRLFSLIPQLG